MSDHSPWFVQINSSIELKRNPEDEEELIGSILVKIFDATGKEKNSKTFLKDRTGGFPQEHINVYVNGFDSMRKEVIDFLSGLKFHSAGYEDYKPPIIVCISTNDEKLFEQNWESEILRENVSEQVSFLRMPHKDYNFLKSIDVATLSERFNLLVMTSNSFPFGGQKLSAGIRKDVELIIKDIYDGGSATTRIQELCLLCHPTEKSINTILSRKAYDIIYYVGHGSEPNTSEGQTNILIENQNSSTHAEYFSATELLRYCDYGPSLLFLNTCHSSNGDENFLLEAIKKGVTSAIGWSGATRRANDFLEKFFLDFLRDGKVALAFHNAFVALRLNSDDPMPQLFLRGD